MSNSETNSTKCKPYRDEEIVFNYQALRLLMGLIALALPIAVSLTAMLGTPSVSDLSSISFSYHTAARNIFVGALFIVGAFLWAYNGHSICESIASKLGALGAILLAVAPTGDAVGVSNFTTTLHFIGAGALFSVLAYFCFVPFQKNTKGQAGKKGRRSIIYFACGCLMVASMLFIFFSSRCFDSQSVWDYRLVYWGEFVALVAFGVAWIVSGKTLSFIAEEDELYRIKFG